LVSVKLDKVTKRFGDFVAIRDITFEVHDGELFFLLGPSGCGKTTTLRIIAGFYKPDEGSVYFNDRLMNDIPPYERNIGMVFQNYALWPHMKVFDNIAYGLRVRRVPRKEIKKRVMEVLKLVKLEKYADRYPNQLSGGQQQRVALARALVVEPDVLLLDEPLSNLDAKLRAEMRFEIKRLQKMLKITTIYVTHDQSEALSMADRLAIMNFGTIEQIGTPREIYSRPKTKFVADFIGETNFIEGIIDEIDIENNVALVDTPLGIIEACLSDSSLKEGDKVICSIRPEAIKFISEKGAYNSVRAKLVNIMFFGAYEVYITEANGVELRILSFDVKIPPSKIGMEVNLFFKPEDVILLVM